MGLMRKESLPFGATPIEDCSGLKLKYINTLGALYEAEYENITKATILYMTSNRAQPMSLQLLYKIHKSMFSDVWDWAGKKRTTNFNIGVDKIDIDVELKKLLEDIFYLESKGESLLYVISVFHHRLVKIHPFTNGNGRWARLVLNVYLRGKKEKELLWPTRDMGEFRKRYINALKDADKGDLTPLMSIHELIMKEGT